MHRWPVVTLRHASRYPMPLRPVRDAPHALCVADYPDRLAVRGRNSGQQKRAPLLMP